MFIRKKAGTFLVPLLAIAALSVIAPALASAHAILMSSSPAVNSRIAGPDVALSLQFNSRIDKSRSRLKLHKPDGTSDVLPISPLGPDDTLAATAHLDSGKYSLRWQVLAIDGHITRGDVPFTVTPP